MWCVSLQWLFHAAATGASHNAHKHRITRNVAHYVPDLVTQATSGAKPSTWSFSRLSTSSVINRGK